MHLLGHLGSRAAEPERERAAPAATVAKRTAKPAAATAASPVGRSTPTPQSPSPCARRRRVRWPPTRAHSTARPTRPVRGRSQSTEAWRGGGADSRGHRRSHQRRQRHPRAHRPHSRRLYATLPRSQRHRVGSLGRAQPLPKGSPDPDSNWGHFDNHRQGRLQSQSGARLPGRF